MIQVKQFVYRRPRHRIDIPIVVRVAHQYSMFGRCTEISAEGLGMRLSEVVPPGKMVEVEFTLEGRSLRVAGQIQYRRDENCYGLQFSFSSKQEQEFFKKLIESIHKIK